MTETKALDFDIGILDLPALLNRCGDFLFDLLWSRATKNPRFRTELFNRVKI